MTEDDVEHLVNEVYEELKIKGPLYDRVVEGALSIKLLENNFSVTYERFLMLAKMVQSEFVKRN